ncbi:MAG: biliverdin-producing heme oxygenase [Bacteroidota bacterium]
MTLQEKLKAHTQSLHNELEQQMFVNQIMQKTLNIEQYKQLVSCNYLVHWHHEDEIFDKLSIEIADKIGVHKRKKLHSLSLDVDQVGLKKQQLEQINITKLALKNEYAALGAMYVLEGATLGGSVIIKQLRLNPNFPETFNFSYYGIYYKELIPNWQEFLSHLNALPAGRHDDVLAGAEQMFNEILNVAERLKNIELS